MEDLSVRELEELLEKKRKTARTTKKKKMKTSKKVLLLATLLCLVLIIFSMAMTYLGRDSSALSILAGAGVAILPIMFGIYEKYETPVRLMHMEKNYNPDYDEEKGIY